jgi:pimeloyl-ACP methyl ester carboxylesterase
VSEADRAFYATEYARPDGMRATMDYFRAFDEDNRDFAAMAKTKLTMPMLVLSGEKSGGDFLINQGRMVDTNVKGVIIRGSGHWLIDEAPEATMSELVAFIEPPAA